MDPEWQNTHMQAPPGLLAENHPNKLRRHHSHLWLIKSGLGAIGVGNCRVYRVSVAFILFSLFSFVILFIYFGGLSDQHAGERNDPSSSSGLLVHLVPTPAFHCRTHIPRNRCSHPSDPTTATRPPEAAASSCGVSAQSSCSRCSVAASSTSVLGQKWLRSPTGSRRLMRISAAMMMKHIYQPKTATINNKAPPPCQDSQAQALAVLDQISRTDVPFAASRRRHNPPS